MKIIFEGTSLATTYSKRSQNPRTGTSRVAQQILENILSKNCKVGLASTMDLPALMEFLKENSFPCVNSEASKLKAQILKQIISAIPKQGFLENSIRNFYHKFGLLYINSYQCDKKELNSYDIFHSPAHPFPSKISENKSIKKLITVHDIIPKLLPEYAGKSYTMDKILERIDEETYVACVSESAKNDLLNYHKKLNPTKVSVIPLAADSSIFYQEKNQNKINFILKKYGIDSQKPYFLLLSTLEPRKNIQRSMGAFAQLIEQEKIRDLQLVLVGSEGKKIAKIFETLNLSTSVKKMIITTGFVDDVDLAAIYSGAMTFIYPSIYEGFGLPPLEAMQCGVPVITSNNSSLPEVVGEAAIMVNALDQEAIASSMLDIYSDMDFRTELKAKSLKQSQKFSWEKFDSQYWDLYQKIYKS